MLTADQLAVIKATVPVLQEHGETLTRHFYQRMFEHNPEVRPYFNPAHQRSGSQQRALAGAICAYAQHVDNPAALTDAVELIAQKHVSLGIRPEHYPIVGENLLASIKEVLGDAATDDIIDAWAAAYGALADIFIGREADIYQEQEQRFGWQGFKPFVVARREPESDNITSFYLRPADGAALQPHKPGQYITLRVDVPGAGPVMRNYSLSNAPGDEYYRISVKREAAPVDDAPDGVCSNHLHANLKEGDHVELAPPAGEFVLDTREQDAPVVLIAGGVGITPLLSMLHQCLAASPASRPVTLIQGALNSRVHPFRGEVQALAAAHPNLQAHVRYSDPLAGDQPGQGYHSNGLIDDALLDELTVDGAHYYLCGPEPMLRHVHALLGRRGVPLARIHYEFFGPAAALAA